MVSAQTSLDAFVRISESGSKAGLSRRIFCFLKYQHVPLTRNEIAEFLHVKENSVNPRVRELVERGLVFEVGTRRVNGFCRKVLSTKSFVHKPPSRL